MKGYRWIIDTSIGPVLVHAKTIKTKDAGKSASNVDTDESGTVGGFEWSALSALLAPPKGKMGIGDVCDHFCS